MPPGCPVECPSENALAAFAEGKLEASGATRFDHHLEQCSLCRSLLVDVTGARPSPSAVGSLDTTTGAASGVGAAPATLTRGSRIGRYVIEKRIGAGAMGTVYAARDPDLQRLVALKLLRAELAHDEAHDALRARLLREAQAMARLSHPNVITIYDVGTFGGQLFIAMELVEGGTLRDWLARERQSWRQIVSVFLQAGAGLAGAHAAGLVHRDFKPDNVLIGHDGRVRVTDFGLARAIERPDDEAPVDAHRERAMPDPSLDAALTHTGTLVGTPAYMSPEQLWGGPTDARSDLFGFCVALYEALYRQRPFEGATVGELESSILRERVRPEPRETRVPSWVRRALLAGLRAAPEARYASMEALLAALADRPRVRARALVGGGVALLAAGAFLAARGLGSGPAARTSLPLGTAVVEVAESGGARAAAPAASEAQSVAAAPLPIGERATEGRARPSAPRASSSASARAATRAPASAPSRAHSPVAEPTAPPLDPLADQK